MIKKQEKISNLIKESDSAFSKGNYLSAIEFLQDSLLEDPTNMESHYRLGIILIRLEKYKDAIKHFDLIIKSEYQFLYISHVYTLKGFAQSQINDLKGAKKSLTNSLKYGGNNIFSLSILGYIHYIAKEYKVALRMYDNILNMDASNYNALNSKGYILIESDTNVDKGLEFCLKAYTINPNSPSVIDSIGWGYYKKGNLKKSTTFIKRAYEMQPNSKEIKYHLRKVIGNIK